MWVSSDDQAKIYLNGKLLYHYAEPRTAFPDQDCISGIELKGGVNVLVFKVINSTFDWGGSIRFADAADNPVSGIRVLTAPP